MQVQRDCIDRQHQRTGFHQIDRKGIVGHNAPGHDHIVGHRVHLGNPSDDREKYALDDVFDFFTMPDIF